MKRRQGGRQSTMDMFVVRSPKTSPAASPTKQTGVLRQATLETLKGVVVIEEMERAKVVLERDDVSTELKVDTLQHLLRKNPAKEVLLKTQLGKTVHKLCRAKDAEVAGMARQVYDSWKKHILSKMNRPYIEVKCDLKTQKLRASAKRMLTEVLQREDEEDQHKSSEESSTTECKSNSKSHKQVEGKETKDRKENVKETRKEGKERTPSKRQREDSDSSYGHESKHKKVVRDENKESPAHRRPREDSDAENIKQETKHKEETRDDKRNKGSSSHHKRSRQDDDRKSYHHHKSKHKERVKDENRSRESSSHRRHKEGSDTEEYIDDPKPTQEKEREGKGESERTGSHSEERQDGDSQNVSVEMLAEHLEHKVYHGSNRFVDILYRRTVRSMVFALRHQRDVRKAVVSGALSVQDFVKQHMKS